MTLGHTKESTRKAAQIDEIITASPGLIVRKLTTADLWAPPPILPHHKNVHLVILSHGLHSNLTADMLYLKERIEKTAGLANRPDGGVIVRGYSGNVCKTERGIKHLGRRMANWLLHETLWLHEVGCFAPDAPAYSRISFIGHSLGGVVQNFAIAMVELLTNGQFFKRLRPVHLITLASPWLGVSAENPAYVKLALDMGLIGRTGQDLGLMNRLGQRFDGAPEQKPIRDSRPILRLLALPDSPAHRVIKRFCTRTIYANVINDGIVPLRTSAMFFLDWNSFDTVQKSVAQNGVMTQLGNLPGMVGLPILDTFFGGFERIFNRSDSDESKSSTGSSNEPRSSNEEPNRSQIFPIPSFLRRTSAQAVPMVKPAEQVEPETSVRRQSLPTMRVNSFDLAEEVAQAMGENMNREKQPSNMHSQHGGESLQHDLGTWDKERRGDDIKEEHPITQTEKLQKSSRGSIPSIKSVQFDLEPKDHPGNISTSHSPQTGGVKQKPGINTDSTSGTSSDSQKSGTVDNANKVGRGSILSDNLVSSPSDAESHSISQKSSESPPNQAEHTITGPPKDGDPSQGDTSGNPLFSFFQHLRPSSGKQTKPHKISKVYRRSQTINKSPTDPRPPPPRTTFFESFPSLINPPLPDAKFITDPSSRAKTIFHDRLYSPEDIPPVTPSRDNTEEQTTKRQKLRLEEKIARDWHSDMTWRKVLVKLEPDAHNNIIVRRMFPNAYGWPVVEHLVREHFSFDPEGLESEFMQESGILPLDAGSSQWEAQMLDLGSDEDSPTGEDDKPESVGRALMSDEDEGNVLEMTEFRPRTRGDGPEDTELGENVDTPLARGYRDDLD